MEEKKNKNALDAIWKALFYGTVMFVGLVIQVAGFLGVTGQKLVDDK